MLTKFLSNDDKVLLIDLLELLALSDKPLLWGGRKREEITSLTNLSILSIQEGELEVALIADIRADGPPLRFLNRFPKHAAKARLVEKLKTLSLQQAELPEARVDAGFSVMRDLLEGKKFERPSVPKLMLFELMLLALCDGNISSIEWALLKEFQCQCQLEDFVFDDLLERAKTMNQEVSKTISIILE